MAKKPTATAPKTGKPSSTTQQVPPTTAVSPAQPATTAQPSQQTPPPLPPRNPPVNVILRRSRLFVGTCVVVAVCLVLLTLLFAAREWKSSQVAATNKVAAAVADNLGNLRGKGEEFAEAAQRSFMRANDADVHQLIEEFVGPNAQKASEGLANVNSEATKDALRKALNDPRSSVSTWAQRTLRRMSGEDTRATVSSLETRVNTVEGKANKANANAEKALTTTNSFKGRVEATEKASRDLGQELQKEKDAREKAEGAFNKRLEAAEKVVDQTIGTLHRAEQNVLDATSALERAKKSLDSLLAEAKGVIEGYAAAKTSSEISDLQSKLVVADRNYKASLANLDQAEKEAQAQKARADRAIADLKMIGTRQVCLDGRLVTQTFVSGTGWVNQ